MSDLPLVEGKTQRMERWTLFKPLKDGTGSAMGLEARFKPLFKENGFLKDVDGGLFAIFARQNGFKGENASFDWPGAYTVNLGLPDVSTLLATWQTRWTPHPLVWIKDGENLQLYHQTAKGNTVIKLSVNEKGSSFAVSKGKGDEIRIRLSVPDEVIAVAYLTQALNTMLRVGAK